MSPYPSWCTSNDDIKLYLDGDYSDFYWLSVNGEHQCMYVPFVTELLSLLYLHSGCHRPLALIHKMEGSRANLTLLQTRVYVQRYGAMRL